ncbi:uncharacterized protein LOC113796990 isoform X1 [Dermatophagoides pteronyssinus]|uniref:uncharacterized protein LOC113796990 isoform X1 n=1 Tax=Dermatophagoides pteronyssinus TaxID=6956 RepID=UPI003F675306
MDGKNIQVDSAINLNFDNLVPDQHCMDNNNLYYSNRNRGRCILLDYLADVRSESTVRLLQSTFGKLNYQFECYRGWNDRQTLQLLNQGLKDESFDSLIVLILTTSCRQVIECANRTRINSHIIVNKLNGKFCKPFAGKPKVIMIQEYCNKLASDGPTIDQHHQYMIPSHADMLIYTYRGKSQLFWPTLCSTLVTKTTDSLDLVKQLTMVTKCIHQQTGIITEMFSTLIKLFRI